MRKILAAIAALSLTIGLTVTGIGAAQAVDRPAKTPVVIDNPYEPKPIALPGKRLGKAPVTVPNKFTPKPWHTAQTPPRKTPVIIDNPFEPKPWPPRP